MRKKAADSDDHILFAFEVTARYLGKRSRVFSFEMRLRNCRGFFELFLLLSIFAHYTEQRETIP